MKKLKLIAVIMVLLLFANILSAGAKTKLPAIGYEQSLVNVCDYGAVPNDGEDDTAAFTIALSASNSIYVPVGVYNISDPIKLNYGTLKGCGTDKSIIVANLTNTKAPIVWAGGRSQIRDITLKYDDSCIAGNEIAGERVGICTTANGERHLCRGAAISNVRIDNVGTGVYSPLKGVIKNATDVGAGIAFSVTFEAITVTDFSYRGFDMQAETRTGNVYRNIYLSSGENKANAGFYMNTEESECSITDLTVANSKLKSPVRFNDCYNVCITEINFINTSLNQDNTGFVYFENSVAHIAGLNFKNSAPDGPRQSFIRVGDNMYRNFGYDCAGYVSIENLNIINPDITVAADSAQKMVSRKNGFVNDFTVEIENYRINAAAELKTQYEGFNKDDKQLKLIIGGVQK